LVVLLAAAHVIALGYWIYRLATDRRAQSQRGKFHWRNIRIGSWSELRWSRNFNSWWILLPIWYLRLGGGFVIIDLVAYEDFGNVCLEFRLTRSDFEDTG